MTSLVYRATKNGSALVYQSTTLLSGAVTVLTLSTTSATVPTLSKKLIPNTFLTTTQFTFPLLAKLTTHPLSTTQVVTQTLTTDTTIASAVTAQTTTTVPTLRKMVGNIRSTVETTIASLAKSFISGAGSSTFFKTLTTTSTTVPSVIKGIQTIKALIQTSLASMSTKRTVASGSFTLTLLTTQTSTASCTLQPSIVRSGAGGAAGRKHVIVTINGEDYEVKDRAEAEALIRAMVPPTPNVKPVVTIAAVTPKAEIKVDPVEEKRRQDEDEIAMLLG